MTRLNMLALAAVVMGATALPAMAKDIHYIMCGDERQARETVSPPLKPQTPA